MAIRSLVRAGLIATISAGVPLRSSSSALEGRLRSPLESDVVVMRSFRSLATLGAFALALAPLAAGADADKTLTNVKGQVSYEHAGAPRKLTPTARIVLVDDDIAVTQTDSQAQVGLPDSSRVTLGASTRVALSFFNQADIASARFVIYGGKTRFIVEHPKGAKSNYIFSTPTSNIAVRGTEGDIAVDGDSLTLNVYNSNTPDSPVEVTFTKGDKIGVTIKVLPGQSLVAQLVNGVMQTQVDKISQAALDKFNELGVPTSVSQVKDTVRDKIKSALPKLPF